MTGASVLTPDSGKQARRENLIFLGPPGVGKSHLAVSLAIAAAQHGRRVSAPSPT